MLSKAPRSRPGSTYAYSNVGYALAGLMAEQVTGESWEMLMRQRLFEPLGMDSAGFGTPGGAGRVDQPWGHHLSGNEIKPTQQDNAPAGTGRHRPLHRTRLGQVRRASPSWCAEKGQAAETGHVPGPPYPPPGDDYAGGWHVLERSWAGGRTLMHNGSNTSWYARSGSRRHAISPS